MRPQHEFERRFLVWDRSPLNGHVGNLIVQAYVFAEDGYTVRIRRTHRPVTTDGNKYEEGPAFVTAKGPRSNGTREEYELQVPVNYATELMRRAPLSLSKTRYQLVDCDQIWDVDVFLGDNEGLVIAECEGEGRGLRRLRKPMWCGREITGDRRYDNEQLARTPFRSWPENIEDHG